MENIGEVGIEVKVGGMERLKDLTATLGEVNDRLVIRDNRTVNVYVTNNTHLHLSEQDRVGEPSE